MRILKLKNLFIIFCTITVIVSSLISLTLKVSAVTYSGNNGNIKWNINSSGLLTISRYTSSGTVTIPDYSTSNYPAWHKYASSIKKIVINSNITKIGNFAFYGLTKATKISIGNSVQTIGTAAFGHCDSLTDFAVLSGNMFFSASSGILYNKLKTTLIAYPANKSGSSFVIPTTVTTIRGYAFHYNQKLTTITQNSEGTGNVKTINGAAFNNCKSLNKVVIRNNCATLGNKVFYNSTALTSVTIPPSVTSIGDDLFSSSDTMNKLRVYCAKNSKIYTYAKNCGYIVTEKDWYFTCKFNAGEGHCDTSSKTVTYASSYGTLPKAEREGYTFDGWYLNNKLITSNSTVTTAASHTLIARYIGNNYTVLLEPNGGYCDTQTITATYGKSYGTLPTPIKSGYTFTGWYSYSGNRVYTDTIFDDDSITTLYAHWIKNIDKVNNLSISYKNKTSIKLSWSKQNNITGYKVYKKSDKGSYTLCKTTSNTSVTVNKLSTKKSYKFKVRAYIFTDNHTTYGAYSDTKSRPKTYVSKPSIKKSVSKGLLTIKWKNISNAKKYQIYVYKNGKYKLSKSTTSLKCFIRTTKGKTYKLKIRAYTAVLGHKIYSKYSKIKYTCK